MNSLVGSWKTSLAGCGAALFTVGAAAASHMEMTPKNLLIVLGIAMSLALLGIFAQDHKDKSAEIEPKKEK